MDIFGRAHCRRERAHMVGHREDMGEVLLVRRIWKATWLDVNHFRAGNGGCPPCYRQAFLAQVV